MASDDDDDDDDYMSNDFLLKLEQQDVRPGLVFSSKTARKNAMEKRKSDCDLANLVSKKTKTSTTNSLKESLAKPLDSNNVGFSLLAKMGYKQGSGLGKSGEGRTEPVPLNVKLDRTGLGTEALQREQKMKAENMLNEVRGMRAKAMSMQREQFRNDKMSQFYDKRMASVFANSQKICHHLDLERDLKEPAEFYFWPQSELDDSEECTNDDDHIGPDDHDDYVKRHSSREDQDKAMQQREEKFSFTADELRINLSKLEEYLREKYLYCIWCSTRYQEFGALLVVDYLHNHGDMSMQHVYTVKETHTRPITAFGRNPHRREILLGFEDGVIKTYDCETGFLIQTTHGHSGFVSDFTYWWNPKFLFSTSNDGTFIVWASGGGLYYKHKFPYAVYSMALNETKNQIIFGFKARIHVYQLDEKKLCGSLIDFGRKFELYDLDLYHCDIVRRMLLHENRLFTCGYDQRILIFEVNTVSFGNRKVLERIRQINKAHETAIVSMVINHHSVNNPWLATGGFDKSLRLWTLEGDPTFRIDDFQGGGLSSFTYIHKTRTLWVACGLSTPLIYDPKSGDNVTDYVEVEYKNDYPKLKLVKLEFFPQLNIAVGCNVRRHLIVWKYNPVGCVGVLKSTSPTLSLAYTKKEPILVFSGAFDGNINKWERSQANMFTYSQDVLSPKDANYRLLEVRGRRNAKMGLSGGPVVDDPRAASAAFQKMKLHEDNESKPLVLKRHKRIKSAYAGLNVPLERSVKIHRHSHVGQLKQVFVEEMDVLLSACEDGNIYMWGYDSKAVKAMKRVRGMDTDESVTNRVAGFCCRNVFMGHHSCVTSLVLITGLQNLYLLSGGWDRRIMIWNLDTGKLQDSCQMGPVIESKDPKEVKAAMEISCDGAILDMAYSPERNEFAYGCSDRVVYVRKFSPSGKEMTLVNTLVGHLSEVSCVAWIVDLDCWISGSDDSTFRVWSALDSMECVQAVALPGPVTSMVVDNPNQVIVIATQNIILVYDIFTWRILRRHLTLSDSIINCLLLLPERGQYLSGSTDGSVFLWNSYKSNAANRNALTAKQIEQQKVAAILHGPKDYPYNTPRSKTAVTHLSKLDHTSSSSVSEDPITQPQLSREISRTSLIKLTSKSRRYSVDSSVAG